jgi:hypothetical protein
MATRSICMNQQQRSCGKNLCKGLPLVKRKVVDDSTVAPTQLPCTPS